MTAAKRRLVVALDGPASSGKSSVGAAVAAQLGYRFCDTGLLYRAVTWLALRRGLSADDGGRLVELVREIELAPDEQGRLARVTVDGIDETVEVHGPDVDAAVSAIAAVGALRAALLERQRSLAEAGGIVMAGRDIGTVVLPDADLKVYLDATAEERARRRAEERGIDPTGPGGLAILDQLRRRDALDTGRAVAPLRRPGDAVVIGTDGNAFDETVALVVAAIRAAEGHRAATSGANRASSRDLPETPIAGRMTPIIAISALVARLLARAVTRVRIEGAMDHLPRSGPLIIAANHASNADPVVVGAFLTASLGRPLNWLGKRELFAWPLIGWLARHGGIHAVDRGAADIEAFRIARRILDAGHVLAVFPEGTRSPTGALQEAKDGLAVLALRTGAHVVPVAIIDSDRVWPKGRRLPRPGGRVIVRIGEPFLVGADEDAGRPASHSGTVARRESHRRATAAIMGRIAGLLPLRQRGAYADVAIDPAASTRAPSGGSPDR